MADKPLSQSNKICVGTIIEFMQDNAPQIAWVMEEQGGKIRLMLPNRRESNLSSARLLPWHGPVYTGTKHKDEIAQLLLSHKENRKALQSEIDTLSLWEMTQGEVTQERASFFAEFMESEPSHDYIAACAHALLEKKSHFKFQTPFFDIYSQETVDQKLEAEKSAKEREVLIGGGANWFHHLWELHQKGKVYTSPHSVEPEEPILSRLKNLLLNRIVDPETNTDDVLWKQVVKQLPDESHLALLIATAWGLVPDHYNFWLARADYNPSIDFAIDHTDFIASMSSLVQDLQNMGTENSIDSLRNHVTEVFQDTSYAQESNSQTLNAQTANSKATNSKGTGAKVPSSRVEKVRSLSSIGQLNEIRLKSLGEDQSTFDTGADANADKDANANANVTVNIKALENELNNDSKETEQERPIKSPLNIVNNDYTPVKDFFTSYFDKEFISIDSPQTKDIDDAFTLTKDADGNYDIHIALACPACAWDFNSPFDKLIAQRTSSLYLPEATYHMMPEALSTEVFSLNENQIKPVLICYCKVSATGEILSSNWDFARTTVKNNLHYNACEAVLNESSPIADEHEAGYELESLDFLEHMDSMTSEDNQPAPQPIKLDDECLPCPNALLQSQNHKETLLAAYEFAQARLAYRIEQGSIIIEKDDMRIRLEEQEGNTQVFIEYIAQNPKAQLIVSELMILANAALANFAVEKNIPLVFRSQDLALPKEFAGVWKKPQDIAKVARFLSGATTNTTAKPHAGLGLKAYSPVTSPLRRYGDLVNEAQLLHFLYTQNPLWNKEELDKLLFNFHIHNDAVSQVQRMRPRYWRFVYIQQEAKRQSEKCGFHAIVSDENDMYVTITLSREQLLVRAKRNLFGDKALLGQEVYVRLGKINPLRGEMNILSVQDLY